MAGEVKHLFVLMLENRSFDHMLGRCGVAGVEGVQAGMSNPGGPNGDVAISDDAPDTPTSDPHHEYPDVQMQIFGTRVPGPASPVTMDGFVKSGGPSVMQGFTPKTLPILNQLASEFVVCDHWFSSMPGPTWPNRFFVHAGSSGGLDNSPSDPHSAIAVLDPDGWWGFEFENGTIYDRVDAANAKWRVYHGDHFPQVLSIKGLVKSFVQKSETFRSIDPSDPDDVFARDIRNGYDVAYTFIEPNYAILGGAPNSQHPKGTASAGEELIKYVYETIRNSRIWSESALVVTYDEHGGFFDHMAPRACAKPGDAPLNHKQAETPEQFDFARYGVRVPTLIISPRVKRGVPWKVEADHTAILATLREIFPAFGPPLTNRDRNAPSFADLLRGPLRDSPTKLNDIAGRAQQSRRLAVQQVASDDLAPPDPILKGFSRIAADVAREMRARPRLNQSTIVAHAHVLAAARGAGRIDLQPVLRDENALVVPKMATTAEARNFIQSVVTELNAR